MEAVLGSQEQMKLITAPNCGLTVGDRSTCTLFLAGGISGCGDWQKEMIQMLRGGAIPPLSDEWTILNPRRPDYQNSPEEARKQIEWEYAHLSVADAVSFWFPSVTLCPITLLELGRWSGIAKPIFVGVDPAYARKLDVEVQIGLVRPYIRIVHSLRELAHRICTEAPEIEAGKRGRQ